MCVCVSLLHHCFTIYWPCTFTTEFLSPLRSFIEMNYTRVPAIRKWARLGYRLQMHQRTRTIDAINLIYVFNLRLNTYDNVVCNSVTQPSARNNEL